MIKYSWFTARWTIGLVVFIISPFEIHSKVADRNVREQSANDQCGQDRRCRIERLRSINQQRRLRQSRYNDQRVINFQKKFDQKTLQKMPRELYPFTIDLEAMTGPEVTLSGIGGTWQWLEHLKVVGAYYPTCDVSTGYSTYYEAYLNGQCIKGGVRYLNSKSAFTTYFDLYAMHMLLEGDMSVGSYNDETALGGYVFSGEVLDGNNEYYGLIEYGELEAHILGFGAGIDWMIGQRFHFRFGLVTHYVLFASLRDTATRANLIEGNTEQIVMGEVMSLSFDLSIGYAF